MKSKRIISIVLVVFLLILIIIAGWAPWLSAEKAKIIVKTYQNFQEQHSVEKGQENPEIYVTWFPFCRWVTTYEGRWAVCFWQTL